MIITSRPILGILKMIIKGNSEGYKTLRTIMLEYLEQKEYSDTDISHSVYHTFSNMRYSGVLLD